MADIFHNVKSKWGREKSSSEDTDLIRMASTQDSSDVHQDVEEVPNWSRVSDPPRLEVLSDLSRHDLQRSSTFRAALEKAAIDINNKYGTVQSLPDTTSRRTQVSWLSTLPASVRMIPVPPRNYSRPTEQDNTIEAAAEKSVGAHTDAMVSANSCNACGSPTCCRRSRGVPSLYIDKVLEETKDLRTSVKNYD